VFYKGEIYLPAVQLSFYNIMYCRTSPTMAEAEPIGLVHTSRVRNPRIIDLWRCDR